MRAKLREGYRFKNATLLGGIEFTKASWTTVPRSMENQARLNADILEIEGESQEQSEKQAERPGPKPPTVLVQPSTLTKIAADVGNTDVASMLKEGQEPEEEKEEEDETKTSATGKGSKTSKSHKSAKE